VRLKHGQIAAKDLARLGDIAERFGAGVVATTHDQNLLLPGVSRSLVSEAEEALHALGSEVVAQGPKVVACAGASTCKLGLCLSPALADVLATRLRQAQVDGAGGPSTIRISGCPNSCGDHLIAELGLEGTTRRHKGRLLPCYHMLAGGSVAEGRARLGERLGVVPARAVPDLLVAAYGRGATDMDGLRELVRSHATFPADFPEEYYVDFGANEPFTLKGRGPGECGAGVLDIVRADLEEARAAISALAEGASADERSRAIYQATLAAARALLPIFGVDAKKDREIFELVGKRLVEPGWVKPETRTLLDAVVDWRLGDLDSLDGHAEVAKNLTQRVQELFQSLDGQLAFRATKVVPHPAPTPSEEPKPKELDLRGVACPMNFVKTKVALEKLPVGDTLEVLLDDGEPIRNVPASLTAQGQAVLGVGPEGSHFRVRVRRSK
jgi:sulfite reductase (ferredoxin)